MIRLLPIMLLAACAKIDMPTPISLPSICMDDESCEARKNAETLAAMGYPDAGLTIMCSDPNIRMVLSVQCKSDALPYP